MLKMKILFHDTVYQKEYTYNTLLGHGLGGTEATVLRIAHGLKDKGHKVGIQQTRVISTIVEGVHYLNEKEAKEFTPDVVITLRDPFNYLNSRTTWPNAKHYFWLHDIVSGSYEALIKQMFEHIGIPNFICVSEFHKKHTAKALYPYKANIIRLYNPTIVPEFNDKSYDKNQLIFISSPHKGLDQVLYIFKELHRNNPQLKLIIHNPGYYKDKVLDQPGVHSMGILPQAQSVHNVAHSLAVLYPQNVFRETFGLIYTEANAVGTPVLSYDFGSASEVLDNPESQLINTLNIPKIVDIIESWRNGNRPIVKAKEDFKLENVLKDWESKIL